MRVRSSLAFFGLLFFNYCSCSPENDSISRTFPDYSNFLARLYLYDPDLNAYKTCSGAIINEKTILTLAHCTDGFDIDNSVIVVGQNKDLFKHSAFGKAQKVYIHGDFIRNQFAHDISLIILEKELNFTDYVNSIDIDFDLLQPSDQVEVYSFGTTTGNNRVIVPIKEDFTLEEICENRNVRSINLVCAKSSHFSPVDIVCMNDIGGVVLKNRNFVGLLVRKDTSHCGTDEQDVIIRLSSFKKWINEFKYKSN